MSHLLKVVFGDIGLEDWQLEAGHFISAKMVPQIIHPRTDAEMAAYARAARCPSAIPWEIPIVVQGGAWPFKYELVIGPSGMDMQAETLPSDWLTNGAQGYGILAWSNPTVGSHTIEVKVTDQDGTETSRTWTLEVIDRENTTYFLFLDSVNGADGASGAYTTPRRTFGTGMYGGAGAHNTSTFPNRQCFMRAGTYTTIESGSTEQMDMASTLKPMVFVAYPGESVTLDCAAAFLDFDSAPTGDICMSGLTFTNPGPYGTAGAERKQFVRIAFSGAGRRLFYDNFYNGGGDTASDDGSNSSCVMNSAGALNTPGAQYGCDVHCTYHQCDNMDFALYYNTNDHVAEFNLVTGGYGGTHNPSWGFFIKGFINERFSIRANRGISGTINRPLCHCTDHDQERKGDVEVCWNSWKSSAASVANASGYFSLGAGSGAADDYGAFWSYRNNANIPFMEPTDLDSGTFEFENDVIQHDGTHTDGVSETGSSATVTKTDLATGTSGILDGTTNLLTGAARTTYLGTHGCEVA